MDENYIDIVRKSLYTDSQYEAVNTLEMPRTAKKIKFSMSNYNSETVFTQPRREKLQTRECTPFKKKDSKKRKVMPQNGDNTYEDGNRFHTSKSRKPTPFKKKLPKKQKIVISFSSSDSFEEDMKNNSISPSKSELESFRETSQGTFKKSMKKDRNVLRNIFDENSESEESVDEFNLDNFFNTCELSFNESITEAHSGIDYEFVSDHAKDVKIIGSDLSVTRNNREQDTIRDSDVEYICEESDRSISPVATKIQESETFEESVVEDQPVYSVNSDSPQFQGKELGGEFSLENAVEYYDIEDWKLVILKEHQVVCVYGLFSLKVIHGRLEILGHILDTHSKEVNLYSPRGSALLHIKNVTNTESDEELVLKNLLPNIPLEDATVKEGSVIFKCTKLSDVKMSLVEKYISQQIFPKIDNNNLPQVIFEPTENWNVVKENYRWDEILSNVDASTKLLLAGGKGVGKSTFLRFAINRLLNKFDKVMVVDLDPGQSEFAVPGCVSIVTITEPIFGPNYTHLKVPDRSLLSNINVGHDPAAYIKCIKHLLTFFETLDECPTLINFMGFTQGIGLNIISSAIVYIQPTDIVQIQSKTRKKNFKSDLSPKTVLENCNMFSSVVDSDSVSLNYQLHKVPAMTDDNEGWALEPRQSREICVLAYFGRMMLNGIQSLTSHELPMYKIELSSIKISNLQGEEMPPVVANANLVALCSLDEEEDIFKCLGYGIVRGIDLGSKSLVLLTPEPPSVLEEVYYLVIGSVMLPPSVYMTPDDVRGSIPYVMKGELASFGQITKRSYLPPVNKE